MKINESVKNTIYHNLNQKAEQAVDTQKESRIKESFDVSIIHQNRATTYNTAEAQDVLKNINYDNEVQSFSKENLEGFAQPLTQAQAHLSSHTVNQLLQ
jgi:hypothetical protein